jgi:acyl-CoA reductase-like NAD-dependent aldehyde dehydrogenase
VPLIAETGGLNAMVVDSSALPEQVVDAVVQSAFRSAGQRCSALRLLCLHERIADGGDRHAAAARWPSCAWGGRRRGHRCRPGDRRRGPCPPQRAR